MHCKTWANQIRLWWKWASAKGHLTTIQTLKVCLPIIHLSPVFYANFYTLTLTRKYEWKNIHGLLTGVRSAIIKKHVCCVITNVTINLELMSVSKAYKRLILNYLRTTYTHINHTLYIPSFCLMISCWGVN